MRFWFHVMVIFCFFVGFFSASASAKGIHPAPEPEQIQWLEANAHALDFVAAGNGFADLEFLREMVGEARIVGLGECTHGSREVFQMKHRLLEYLATEMGFTVFSIEASAPEAFRLNDYVLGGEGDPAELIGGMYFWTWNTEEVLAMVEWMREFNAAGKGPLQFTGFDMQYAPVAAANVVAFLQEVDPSRAAEVKAGYDSLQEIARGPEFGVATYRFPIEAARGKKITYRGKIRTEGVDEGFAGLWWRTDGPNREILGFDNMNDRGIKGTTDWEEHVISMDVPAEAININFGVILPGSGKAWFDDLVVELDGQPYGGPEFFDLDFEGDKLLGYHSNGEVYRSSLDKEHATSGKQSLLLECIDPRSEEGMPPGEAAGISGRILAELTEQQEELLAHKPADQVDWMLFNARIVDQCMRAKANSQVNIRDLSMAENVEWILNQNPGAKIVLWAHNGHISRREGWMGNHLARKYGDEYLPVGFCTARGSYYAMDRNNSNTIHTLQEPPTGSIEEFFDSIGPETMVLDLRSAVAGSSASGWLHESRLMRSIGAMAMENQFRPRPTASDFDVLVFIKSTSKARQLATKPARN